MSVATISDTMARFFVEFDDRKIYNDIRSQIDVTTTKVIVDEVAVYERKVTPTWNGGVSPTPGVFNHITKLDPNETKEWYMDANPGDLVYSWGHCWAYLTPTLPFAEDEDITVEVVEQYDHQCKVNVINETSSTIWGIYLKGYYQVQVLPSQSHSETQTETITIRTTDTTSIKLYGRRSMNLTWPLGQTQAQMQSLIEGYKNLYKDPVPYLRMVLLGRDDTLKAIIFTLRVSDRVTITQTRLGISSQDFIVTTVNVSHDHDGLPVGDYTIEEIPTAHSVSIFTLDSSSLDGTDVLG